MGCLEQAEVKATLEACQKERGLKLVKGRLFCKGDVLVKPKALAKVKRTKKGAHKTATKAKKITEAKKITKAKKHHKKAREVAKKRPAQRPAHVTVTKARSQAKQVVKPPPSLTCEACRDHLTKTCQKLSGNKGMATCEKDPRFKNIFQKIRDSCVKFRGLVQHKDGSLGCKSDAKKKTSKSPPTATHVAKPKPAKHAAKPKPTLPKMPPMPTSKHEIAKHEVAHKSKKVTKTHAAKVPAHKSGKQAHKQVAKAEVLKKDKAKAASAQVAAKKAHAVMEKAKHA